VPSINAWSQLTEWPVGWGGSWGNGRPAQDYDPFYYLELLHLRRPAGARLEYQLYYPRTDIWTYDGNANANYGVPPQVFADFVLTGEKESFLRDGKAGIHFMMICGIIGR